MNLEIIIFGGLIIVIILLLITIKKINEKHKNNQDVDLDKISQNLENLFKILSRKNIDNILIVTAPYFTKRTSLLWSKYSDKIEANYYKTVDWPDNKLSLFKNSQ